MTRKAEDRPTGYTLEFVMPTEDKLAGHTIRVHRLANPIADPWCAYLVEGDGCAYGPTPYDAVIALIDQLEEDKALSEYGWPEPL